MTSIQALPAALQHAPQVRVEVGPDRGWRLLAALLGGAAVAALAGWALPPVASTAAVATLAALLGALAMPRLLPPATGLLQWDGGGWRWRDVDGDVAVQADLGVWVLLRFDATATTQRPRRAWIALAATSAGPDWHALRLALHAPRSR